MDKNKSKLTKLFLLIIYFILSPIKINGDSIDFKIQIETSKGGHKFEMSEERAMVFIDEMRIVLEKLKGEITETVCEKLTNGEIPIKKREIEELNKFLQEEIIPSKFKTGNNKKCLGEMILFYQMAKISLRIAKELDINDEMKENILCGNNPRESCRHANYAKTFEGKLKNLMERIRKFLEMPPVGFLRSMLNYTMFIAFWGNMSNKGQPFHEILEELDEGFQFQTVLKKSGNGEGKSKENEGGGSGILKSKENVTKENEREEKNKELEKTVNPIFENRGNNVKGKKVGESIDMLAYKARELIAEMDGLMGIFTDKKILPFSVRDKVPSVCRALANSLHFGRMVSEKMEYFELIAEYRAKGTKELRWPQYDEKRNILQIRIPTNKAAKLLAAVEQVLISLAEKRRITLCGHYGAIFRRLDLGANWEEEIFKDLKDRAELIFNFESGKINCFDEMLELRTFVAIAKKIFESKNSAQAKNELVEKVKFILNGERKENDLGQLQEDFDKIEKMVEEWMAVKVNQKNGLEDWKEFEEKHILKRLHVLVDEGEKIRFERNDDKNFINCVHNLVSLRILDAISWGLAARATKKINKEEQRKEYEYAKQIRGDVFPEKYTHWKDYEKFKENLVELRKVITSTLGGISNRNGKLDVDLWADTFYGMEKKEISKYEFRVNLNFDKTNDPREIKKRLEEQRLEEELRKKKEEDLARKKAEKEEAEKKQRKIDAEKAEKAARERAEKEKEIAAKQRELAEKRVLKLIWNWNEISTFIWIIMEMVEKIPNLKKGEDFCRKFLYQQGMKMARTEFWELVTFQEAQQNFTKIRQNLAKNLNKDKNGNVHYYHKIDKEKELSTKTATNCIYDVVIIYAGVEIANYILGKARDNDRLWNLLFPNQGNRKNFLRNLIKKNNVLSQKAEEWILASGIIDKDNWNAFSRDWILGKFKIKNIDSYKHNEPKSELNIILVRANANQHNQQYIAEYLRVIHHGTLANHFYDESDEEEEDDDDDDEDGDSNEYPYSYRPEPKGPKGKKKNAVAEPQKQTPKGTPRPTSKPKKATTIPIISEEEEKSEKPKNVVKNSSDDHKGGSSLKAFLEKNDSGKFNVHKKEESSLKAFLKKSDSGRFSSTPMFRIISKVEIESSVPQEIIYDNVEGDGDCLFRAIVRTLNAGIQKQEKLENREHRALRRMVAAKLVEDAEKRKVEALEMLMESIETHVKEDMKNKKGEELEVLMKNIKKESNKDKKMEKRIEVVKEYAKYMEVPANGNHSRWGGFVEMASAQKVLGRKIVVIELHQKVQGEFPDTLKKLEDSIKRNKNLYKAYWLDYKGMMEVTGAKNDDELKEMGLIEIVSLKQFFIRLTERKLETTIVLTRFGNHFRPIYKIPPTGYVRDLNVKNLNKIDNAKY